MELDPYVAAVQRQLAAAAEAGGDDARELAARLAPALESAVRLALQDALAAAASEITLELAPGSVELRLRGRDPEFVVVAPQADVPDHADPQPAPATISFDADQGALARINLRVPPQLKERIEAAATSAGLSVNSWLVRTAALAAEGATSETRVQGISRDARKYRGWAR